MGCLYCGKEIGAFRLLRGDEFCNVTHRQLYDERLGKALGRIRAAEPAPVGIAGFCVKMPLQDNGRGPSANWQMESPVHAIHAGRSWPIEITPLLGSTAKALSACAVSAPPAATCRLSPEPILRLVYMPDTPPARLSTGGGTVRGATGLAGAAGLQPREPKASFPRPDLQTAAGAAPLKLRALQIGAAAFDPLSGRPAPDPPACEEWMLVPVAEAAMRTVAPSTCDCIGGQSRPILPTLAALDLTPAIAPAGIRFHRHATAQLATPAIHARASLAAIPMGAEAATLRLPDVASLRPTEDVLQHVKVAQPEGFAVLRLPDPVQVNQPAAVGRPAPIENREGVDPGMPAALVELRATLETRVPEATGILLLTLEPHAQEPSPCVPELVSAAMPWAAREAGVSGVAFEFTAGAPLAALAPSEPGQPVDIPRVCATRIAAEIEWPAANLRLPAHDLQVRREAPLAGIVALQSASPAEPRPAALSLSAEPLGSSEGDHAVQLPEIVHRPLWATPAPAPATQVRQFPRRPNGRSRSESCAMIPPTLCLPKYTPPGPAGEDEAETIPLVPRPGVFQPAAVMAAPIPISLAPAVPLPLTTTTDRPILSAAGFDPAEPKAAEPVPDAPDPGVAVLQPLSTLPANPAAIEAECTPAAVPEPTFIPIEYYCQRASASPRWGQQWHWPEVPMISPGLMLPLAEERSEEPMARPPEPQPSSVTEIFSHPEARMLARRRLMGRLAKIAACLVVGLFMWFGTRVTIGRRTILSETASVPEDRIPTPAPAVAAPVAAPAGSNPSPEAAPEPAPKGFFGRMQLAIAKRATVERTDNFRAGMEAWGAPAKSWAPGWVRNPAGYINPGGLELYKPSQGFTDYRLDFFGQIENKAMGWVMRGRDKQNYYAMKFQVLQGGLRPVIAMVHYPVVEGKKGRKSETPLNVMVHHNAPFHVSVEVSGNRFTASIEGQKVDTWTDDVSAMGAAGFFSDAGERARLYWMKVTKNDDFLGTICGFLAGNAKQVAGVWGPRTPGDSPLPGGPAGPPDVFVVEAVSGLGIFSSRRAARTLKHRRNQWNS